MEKLFQSFESIYIDCRFKIPHSDLFRSLKSTTLSYTHSEYRGNNIPTKLKTTIFCCMPLLCKAQCFLLIHLILWKCNSPERKIHDIFARATSVVVWLTFSLYASTGYVYSAHDSLEVIKPERL